METHDSEDPPEKPRNDDCLKSMDNLQSGTKKEGFHNRNVTCGILKDTVSVITQKLPQKFHEKYNTTVVKPSTKPIGKVAPFSETRNKFPSKDVGFDTSKPKKTTLGLRVRSFAVDPAKVWAEKKGVSSLASIDSPVERQEGNLSNIQYEKVILMPKALIPNSSCKVPQSNHSKSNERLFNQLSQEKEIDTHLAGHTKALLPLSSSNQTFCTQEIPQEDKNIRSFCHSVKDKEDLPSSTITSQNTSENDAHRNAQLTTLDTPSGKMEILTIDTQYSLIRRTQIHSETLTQKPRLLSTESPSILSVESKSSDQSQEPNIHITSNEFQDGNSYRDDITLKSDIVVESEVLSDFSVNGNKSTHQELPEKNPNDILSSTSSLDIDNGIKMEFSSSDVFGPETSNEAIISHDEHVIDTQTKVTASTPSHSKELSDKESMNYITKDIPVSIENESIEPDPVTSVRSSNEKDLLCSDVTTLYILFQKFCKKRNWNIKTMSMQEINIIINLVYISVENANLVEIMELMKEIDCVRPGTSKNAVILRTLALITNNIWIKSQDKTSVEEDSQSQNGQKEDSKIGFQKDSISSVKSTNQKNDTESSGSVDYDEQVEEDLENNEESSLFDLPDIDYPETLRADEELHNKNFDIEKQSKNEGIYEMPLKLVEKNSSSSRFRKNKKSRYKLQKVRRTRLHKSQNQLSVSVIDEENVSRISYSLNSNKCKEINKVKKESIKQEPFWEECTDIDVDSPKLYDRLKLLPRKSSAIAKMASSSISKKKDSYIFKKFKQKFKLKSFLILVENGSVYSTVESISRKTDNFLDYLECGAVNIKERNGSFSCVLTEEQKRESLKNLRLLTVKEELEQFKQSSSKLSRKLQIDMCDSIFSSKNDQRAKSTRKKSKKSSIKRHTFHKVKSEPFVEFEWFCLDCENCVESDCQHYDHPRCLVNGDLNRHFDDTGHSWAQPIHNFVKTENICKIEDLRDDPKYQPLIDKSLK